MVAITIDGRLASHAVLPPVGTIPVAVSLGRVDRGSHRLVVEAVSSFSDAVLEADPMFLLAGTDDPAAVALRHSPILHGRTLAYLGGPLQNAVTDVPLLGWHQSWPAGPVGDRILEYSVLWSHEDGGTDGPTLMARWGRTTDIEWVYRVAVDAEGRRIPGTATYQGVGHAERPFAGVYEEDHPLLQVCTDNNMVSDVVDGPLRFALATDSSLPLDRAREVVLELHPWVRRVSAAEVRGAGLFDPDSPSGLGEPDQYLYLELATSREPADGPRSGLAVGVRLAGDTTVHRSDHGLMERTITRDGLVATAVRLPVGTGPGDVAEVLVLCVPHAGASDRIVVHGVRRGYFLDEHLRPGPSFLHDDRPAVLSVSRPRAVVWERAEKSHSATAALQCPRSARPVVGRLGDPF